MKKRILLLTVASILIISAFKSSAQAVDSQDSSALKDFYDSTNGNNWINKESWNTIAPVSSWYGVDVTGDRVGSIEMLGNNVSGHFPSNIGKLTGLVTLVLIDNKITGSLPTSMGNLTSLTYLDISANSFTGNIPSSFVNLTKVTNFDMSSNRLSGTVPSFLAKMSNLDNIDLQYNQFNDIAAEDFINFSNARYLSLNDNNFTFKGIETLAQAYKNNSSKFFYYSSQHTIPVYKTGTKLFVSPGGTLTNDTVRWYARGTGLVATIVGDTTFTPASAGSYYATVTNAIATQLTLISDSTTINAILADTTTTVTQHITGTTAVDIHDGIIKLVTLTPTAGNNALAGDVTTIVTIDSKVSTFNNLPYVQRHYDIVPAANASNAIASVTLYFTQKDFDNYNYYVTSHNLNLPLLPVNGIDNGNVSISQFHGTFTGSSNPANYNQNNVILISPIVVWDPNNSWWTLTFPVSGFSGFYVSTAHYTLPLTLLNFSTQVNDNAVNLVWHTTLETGTKQFIVQRFSNGEFCDIASILTKLVNATNEYRYEDQNALTGANLYRLKIVDKNGVITYSKVTNVNFERKAGGLLIYPNPVNTALNIKITSSTAERITMKITNASGHSMYQSIIPVNAGVTPASINVRVWPPGIYNLVTHLNGKAESTPFLKK